MPDDFEDSEEPENLEIPPAFFPYANEERPRHSADSKDLVQVQIQGVFSLESDGRSKPYFVILTDGARKLPILIGPFEAQAIYLPLKGSTADRPMTHDLAKVIIDRLGGQLKAVIIDDLWNDTFYSRLLIQAGKNEVEIDARPSDAIALAVRFGCPVLVADSVLDSGDEIV